MSGIPRLYSVAEVAETLQISRSLVYQLVETGKLVAHRLGAGRGAIRVSEEDLLGYVEASREELQSVEKTKPKRARLRHLRV